MEFGIRKGIVIEEARAEAANSLNGAASRIEPVSVVNGASSPVELDEGRILRISDIYKNLRDPRMPIRENRDRGHYFVKNRYR